MKTYMLQFEIQVTLVLVCKSYTTVVKEKVALFHSFCPLIPFAPFYLSSLSISPALFLQF